MFCFAHSKTYHIHHIFQKYIWYCTWDACTIWYHLYNLKNMKNSHGGVLLLVKLPKSNALPWAFFMFFTLYKWYQIAQNITFGPVNLVLGVNWCYFIHPLNLSKIWLKLNINNTFSHFVVLSWVFMKAFRILRAIEKCEYTLSWVLSLC